MKTKTDPPRNHRIYEYITKKTFLHFEDSLQIGKLRLFAGSYERGSGADTTLAHYLDTPAARVLLLDMQWSKPVEMKDYKGTSNGQVISRVLSINTKDKGYYVELTSGPGKRTETGAVLPAGKPTESVNIFVTFQDARQIAADILEYMQAWRTAWVQLNTPSANFYNTAETVTRQPETQAAHSQPETVTPPAQTKRDQSQETTPADPYKYKNGDAVPLNSQTRALFDAYKAEFNQPPEHGPGLQTWWEANKPKSGGA